MASPERKTWALDLLAKVQGMGFTHTSLVLDGIKNEWDNGEVSLRAHSGDYLVLLQDDAIISDTFYENVVRAIEKKPNSLISLYTGTSRPFPGRITRAVAEAEEKGASFLQAKSLFWGVGFVIPVKDIPVMLKFVENSTLPFDQRIGLYYKLNRKPVYYTYPSIVDHDYTLDSIVGYDIDAIRRAHKYSDELIEFTDKVIICDNI